VLAGKSAQVLGDPDTKHSYTYLKDLSRVLATLGTDDRAVGEVWHVPNAPARTTTDLVSMIGEELGREIKVSVAPELLLRMMGLFNPTVRELNEMLYEYKSDFVADGEKFTKAFGMEATPLDQAVAETVAWWR
jgi:nucleoside-diphosphate-sugar epimerase